MPMRYANPEDVFSLLKIPVGSVDERARVERIENGLCDNFDEMVNTSFGAIPTAEVRTVWGSGAYATRYNNSWYPARVIGSFGWDLTVGRQSRQYNEMILATRIRTLLSIRTGGDWNGTAWIDDEIVPVTSYTLIHGDSDGYWGIKSLVGDWDGIYRVNAIWSDQSSAGVPSDVREALTTVTVDQYRLLNTSPSGAIGPNGQQIFSRNPWELTSVKSTIARHHVLELIV